MNNKEYTFTYNCKMSCQSPLGMKQKTIKAMNKNQARIKIKEFLENNNGILGHEWF